MNRLVDDIAADWAIRRDAGPLDTAAEAELAAWLAEDERRAGALLRAEAMLALATRATALPSGLGESVGVSGALERRDAPGSQRFGRRAMLAGGAGAMAASILGVFFMGRTGGVEIDTAVGEVRRVPLADGSTAAINTDSRLRVAIDDASRRIEIARGEAFFEVAHDKARPFVVAAGKVRVRAPRCS